jgi:hypothetical protein
VCLVEGNHVTRQPWHVTGGGIARKGEVKLRGYAEEILFYCLVAALLKHERNGRLLSSGMQTVNSVVRLSSWQKIKYTSI